MLVMILPFSYLTGRTVAPTITSLRKLNTHVLLHSNHVFSYQEAEEQFL